MLRGRLLTEACIKKWEKENPGKRYKAAELALVLLETAKALGMEEHAPTDRYIRMIIRRNTSLNFQRAQILSAYSGIAMENIEINRCLIKGQRSFLRTTDKKKLTTLQIEEKKSMFCQWAVFFISSKIIQKEK